MRASLQHGQQWAHQIMQQMCGKKHNMPQLPWYCLDLGFNPCCIQAAAATIMNNNAAETLLRGGSTTSSCELAAPLKFSEDGAP